MGHNHLKFCHIQSKKDLKISMAGFTLIEMMIAIAIVGILTSIGVPNYIKYKEKARIQVAIIDVRFIEKEITTYAVENGELPENLGDIAMDKVLDPWGRPYNYLKIQGNDGKGKDFKPRKDLSLHPINSDFDLYSVGKDGRTGAPLTDKKSKDDIIRANNGGFVGLVSDY
jgi:general secretion pathway protein G